MPVMALANYSFGSNNKDIIFIANYHEAPSLEPVIKRFIEFAEKRNKHIRTLLAELTEEKELDKRQSLVAALSSIQSDHEQDLALFKKLLNEGE
jgi:hypothetical protein